MYCSVCAPSPPIFLCSNFMCYSLFLELGGEMLIDLTFSLCSFTPPPLPRTYMGLFTFSHYSQLFANIMSILVHFCEHFRAVYHYFLCAQIFINFSRTFKNVWTFLQTFSRSFQHCSMSGSHLPLPVHVN